VSTVASLVDSHCHIAGPEFAADLDAVVARAREAGVQRALVILAADDDTELGRAQAVTGLWPEVRFSVGIHPHNAAPFAADPAGAARLTAQGLAGQPHARAVGEIGLDYHYDHAPRDVQQHVFAEQVQLAQRRGLPIVIHTRDAEDDTFAILGEAGPVSGVFHCFTGDVRMARRALDAGFHVSLSGIVTFPRAADLKAVAAFVPADRLLVETDSPYLAPVPHRGVRNEPAYVSRVCAVVAELRHTSVEAVAAETAANFVRIFNP
jgi:TatD DNase family protein